MNLLLILYSFHLMNGHNYKSLSVKGMVNMLVDLYGISHLRRAFVVPRRLPYPERFVGVVTTVQRDDHISIPKERHNRRVHFFRTTVFPAKTVSDKDRQRQRVELEEKRLDGHIADV